MPIHITPDSYTKLLIHSDTTDGSTTFVDSSATGHTITNNNVTHETGQKKFGATGMHFNGTTDFLSIPSSAEHNFTSSDSYMVDFWMYPTHSSGNPCIYAGWGTADNANSAGDHYLYMANSSGKLHWGAVNVNSAGAEWNTGISFTLNVWQHIALVYDAGSGQAYAFKDGIRQNAVSGPAVCSITATTDLFTIGDNKNIDFYKGELDEFRVSKGIARWTADFLPPTRPYSKIDDNFFNDQEGLMTNQSTRHIGTGGSVSYDGNYRIHTFTSSGTLATKSTIIADILSIGGGGGGGTSSSSYGGGGGGGAGAYVYKTGIRMGAGNQSVTVGAGGAGGVAGSSQVGTNGGTSSFSGLPEDDAIGGGGGGAGGSGGSRSGNSGGSGGGAGYNGYNNVTNSSTGVSGEGNDGGDVSGGSASGSGGGGAGGVGGVNTGSGGGTGGVGGAGILSKFSGVSTWYAIGGAGGESGQAQAGANTGGGGNGAYAVASPQAGADGVVIIRYQI